MFTGDTLTDIAVRDEVKNVDGWVFPDGTEGNGVPGAHHHVGPRLDDRVALPPTRRPGRNTARAAAHASGS